MIDSLEHMTQNLREMLLDQAVVFVATNHIFQKVAEAGVSSVPSGTSASVPCDGVRSCLANVSRQQFLC